MAEIQSKLDFNFNGKWLSEFGGFLYSKTRKENINILGESRHKTHELDGKIYFTEKTLEPKIEKLTIFFEEEIDKDMLIEWLDTDEPKPFYYEYEDRQLMCILNSDINFEVGYKAKFKGNLEIEMIAYEPYWTEIVPRYLDVQNPIKGQEYKFYYDGTIEGYPVIKLEGSGTVNFEFNDKQYRIKNFTDNITMDMRYGDIYTELNGERINKYAEYECLNGDHIREMIKIEPYSHNKFKIISGDITRLYLKQNKVWK